MVYKWYILPIGGLYATYHLLREPKTTIDNSVAETFLGDGESTPLQSFTGFGSPPTIDGNRFPPRESMLKLCACEKIVPFDLSTKKCDWYRKQLEKSFFM